MGLLSSSSNKSTTSSLTENIDKRVVADGGSGVVTADKSNLFDTGGSPAFTLTVGHGSSKSNTNSVVNVTDGGAVRAALDFAGRTVDAVAGDGFERLLTLAGDLFEGQKSSNDATISAVQAAYAQADSDKAGSIDNRTMIALAVVAGVAIIVLKGRA